MSKTQSRHSSKNIARRGTSEEVLSYIQIFGEGCHNRLHRPLLVSITLDISSDSRACDREIDHEENSVQEI